MMGYYQLDPKEQTSVKFQWKYESFIQENASENIVSEIAAILSRGRWVKQYPARLLGQYWDNLTIETTLENSRNYIT